MHVACKNVHIVGSRFIPRRRNKGRPFKKELPLRAFSEKLVGIQISSRTWNRGVINFTDEKDNSQSTTVYFPLRFTESQS